METIETIEAKLRRLPPERRREAMAYIDRLLDEREAESRPRPGGPYVSRGSLADVREKHSSVELQHRVLDWWTS